MADPNADREFVNAGVDRQVARWGRGVLNAYWVVGLGLRPTADAGLISVEQFNNSLTSIDIRVPVQASRASLP